MEVPDSLRKGKIESSGFMDVLVHPHCQLDWTYGHHGNTPVRISLRMSLEGLTEDRNPTLNVRGTSPWA